MTEAKGTEVAKPELKKLFISQDNTPKTKLDTRPYQHNDYH